jgi:hypothetical protein
MENNITKSGQSLENARREALKALEPQVLDYARANGPWADRTKAARNNLRTSVIDNNVEHITSLYLAHGVPYGIWLEVRWGGKYAIILPTLMHFGPQVMGQVRKVSFY